MWNIYGGIREAVVASHGADSFYNQILIIDSFSV